MKTIISSILVITGVFSLYSCRQPDDEITAALQIHNKEVRKTASNKNADSTQTIVNIEQPSTGTPITDPPPKDRDQWKVRANNVD